MPTVSEFSVTIANNATDSSAVKMDDFIPVALVMPAAFTGTSVSFLVSDSLGGTYLPLYNGGTLLSVTVAASRHVALDPSLFSGVRFVKVKSASNEAAARTVKILGRRPPVR